MNPSKALTFEGTLALRSPMMQGADVRLIQSYLWDLGYGRMLEAIDGVYGSATQQAVMVWQADTGMANPTGWIEPWDWAALRDQWVEEQELRVRPGRVCR